MIERVFKEIEESDDNIEFAVKVAYIEIYMERIRDLMKRTQK